MPARQLGAPATAAFSLAASVADSAADATRPRPHRPPLKSPDSCIPCATHVATPHHTGRRSNRQAAAHSASLNDHCVRHWTPSSPPATISTHHRRTSRPRPERQSADDGLGTRAACPPLSDHRPNRASALQRQAVRPPQHEYGARPLPRPRCRHAPIVPSPSAAWRCPTGPMHRDGSHRAGRGQSDNFWSCAQKNVSFTDMRCQRMAV
jgi:hypothetical protein